MSFGQITKQIAQQALSNQVKDVVDSLRPPEAGALAESIAGQKPAAPAQADNPGAVIVGQIQAMQNALKSDQELIVLATAGLETLRILEIYAPSWRVAVLTGIDSDKIVTRVICPMESLQLVCKPMPVRAGVKAVPVRIVAPKVA